MKTSGKWTSAINPMKRLGMAAFLIISVSLAAAGATLLSCSGNPGGDFYERGFYVVRYPGVSLTSARMELSAATAGSYVMSLTVRSSTYDGPVLGASTTTVTLNGSTTQNQPAIFTFPSIPIVQDSRVCFILALISGPSTAVFYSVPFTDGCTEVVQTGGTAPPLDTFRRNGVNLVLTGTSPAQTLLTVSFDGTNAIISWSNDGTLQSANDPAGTWSEVPGASSPCTIPATKIKQFFRVRQP